MHALLTPYLQYKWFFKYFFLLIKLFFVENILKNQNVSFWKQGFQFKHFIDFYRDQLKALVLLVQLLVSCPSVFQVYIFIAIAVLLQRLRASALRQQQQQQQQLQIHWQSRTLTQTCRAISASWSILCKTSRRSSTVSTTTLKWPTKWSKSRTVSGGKIRNQTEDLSSHLPHPKHRKAKVNAKFMTFYDATITVLPSHNITVVTFIHLRVHALFLDIT